MNFNASDLRYFAVSRIKQEENPFYSKHYALRPKEVRMTREQADAIIYNRSAMRLNFNRVCFCEKKQVDFKRLKRLTRMKMRHQKINA